MKKALIYSLIYLALAGCGSPADLIRNGNLYEDNGIAIGVSYYLHHENDTISMLYYSIDNRELIYKKAVNDSLHRAKLKIFYKILPTINAKHFNDTATIFINDDQVNPRHGFITGNKAIKIPTGTKVYIDLRLIDLNRKGSNHEIVCINKHSAISNQNYFIKNEDSSLIYTNYLPTNKNYVLSNKRIDNKILSVAFFERDKNLPPPPFSAKGPQGFPTQMDSTFSINRNLNDRFDLMIKKEGLYFLQTDSNYKQGSSYLGVNEDFPKVSSHKQMIESIRYITSKDEYDELLNDNNPKDAIERYWINAGGSMDRAKGLIKKYYGRVQTANTKFTCYKEGWKTDRGMILIIFGEPQYLYQNEGQEVWVYGTPGTPGALRFEFNQKQNPYGDNDYQMIRNAFYKDAWYQAVDAWREGRIYLDN